MSYILDALKKSDKERQKKTVPDLNTTPLEITPQKKKKAPWPIILAAILLGNAIFILVFVTQQKKPATEQEAIVPSSSQAQQEMARNTQKSPAPQATPELAPDSGTPLQSDPAARQAANATAPMANFAQAPAPAIAVPQNETATDPQPVEDVRTENGTEAANNLASQVTPGLSPESSEPLLSEPAAPEDVSTVARMAEDAAASGQGQAPTSPIPLDETAADPQPVEDMYEEDGQESGMEATSDLASHKDVATAGQSAPPETATQPKEYLEKPGTHEPQQPELAATADSSPPEPKESLKKKALHMNQLPGAIRQQLPDIHISAHVFYKNNPAARLASINGKVIREGQMFTPDVKVAEISTDGVIFSYQKYLFYVPVF